MPMLWEHMAVGTEGGLRHQVPSLTSKCRINIRRHVAV